MITKYDCGNLRSHERALEKGLLEGYKVHVTPQVKPDAQQMKGKEFLRQQQQQFISS